MLEIIFEIEDEPVIEANEFGGQCTYYKTI